MTLMPEITPEMESELTREAEIRGMPFPRWRPGFWKTLLSVAGRPPQARARLSLSVPGLIRSLSLKKRRHRRLEKLPHGNWRRR
jgi:hypothetical protein